MAPKAKPGTKSLLKKKVQVVDKTIRPEVQFLMDLSSESSPKDIAKMTNNMQTAIKKQDEDMLMVGLEAVERLCQSDAEANGILSLVKAEGVETVGYISVEAASKEVRQDAQKALATIYRRACEHLDNLDAVDFDEVANVLFFATNLGVLDEDVCLSSLAAIERLAWHRAENSLAMLQGGALQAFHLFLSAHRAPELCHECMEVLFRLCDGPNDFFAPFLYDEKELIQTVVETISDAPLNMRLQVAGLRLLCLWNQPEVYPDDMEFAAKEDAMLCKDKIRQEMRYVGVAKAFKRAVRDLSRSGLRHQASWLNSMASGCLIEDQLKSRVAEIRPAGHFSSVVP